MQSYTDVANIRPIPRQHCMANTVYGREWAW